MPQIEAVQNIIEMARKMKISLENELLCVEYLGTDVNKSRFPDDTSLIGKNEDFLLYRLTGSEIYSALQQKLRSINETACQMTVSTRERVTFKWIVDVFEWVESIQKAVTDNNSFDDYNRMQLGINCSNAQSILDQGMNIFYSVSDEVKETLRGQKISIRPLPQKVAILILKGGAANSPGGHLIRWAALLFNCLKLDVDRAEDWKHRALNSLSLFEKFQSGGPASILGKATDFKDKVDSLITEAKHDLIIQNDDVFCSIRSLSEKIRNSERLKRQIEVETIEAETIAMEKETFKYENTQNIAFSRYDLLDSLLDRLHHPSAQEDTLSSSDVENSDLFIEGEQTVREKSRLFLEKSLVKGLETYGIELSCVDACDFCSMFAWDLEHAIFEKFKSNQEGMSNEYRDKVRSLRFNLQDPKNPMLCARVLAGVIKIPELIAMSSDELASKEIKQMRQQVKEESIKNVVISGNQKKSPDPVNWRKPTSSIDIISKKDKPDSSPKRDTSENSPQTSEKPTVSGFSPLTQHGNDDQKSPMDTQNKKLPSLEPPEEFVDHPSPTAASSADVNGTQMRKFSLSNEFHRTPPPLSPPGDDMDENIPNLPSPVASSQPLGHHIISQFGTDTFSIAISRLKVSFTTKMFVEQSCPWELNGFLPADLVDKGRISIDEFNKFISDKMRSGKWNLIHLKLSSITGESNMTSYKRFYKEYEQIDRICMISVSDDGTKIFLVTPKFLRICKCMSGVENLSRTSTYVVLLTKKQLVQKYQASPATTGKDNFLAAVGPPPFL